MRDLVLSLPFGDASAESGPGNPALDRFAAEYKNHVVFISRFAVDGERLRIVLTQVENREESLLKSTVLDFDLPLLLKRKRR